MITTPVNTLGAGRRVPALARIDLGALGKNYLTIIEQLPDATRVAAVVKSDAYGHGMVECSRALEKMGVRFLVVSSLLEARTLREADIGADVLIIGPVLEDEALRVIDGDFSIAVGSVEEVRFLAHAARMRRKLAKVHLKVDTGMGRFGLLHLQDDFLVALEKILNMEGLHIEGVLTHFAEADNPQSDFTDEQCRRFRLVLRHLEQHGLHPECVHAANSGGVFFHNNAAFSLVRPGIGLYGSAPDPAFLPHCDLAPVMSATTYVADIRKLPKGYPVSYGRTCITKRPTRTALLPAGYGDGYPRALSNRGEVLIRARRAPILGRVTMNLIVVDITDINDVAIGDPVLLFGRNTDGALPIEELAERADTIPYEILCNYGRSAWRVFEGQE
ncbi:MAG: alanine racemase [Candidatus Sumerlaeota bacterium]